MPTLVAMDLLTFALALLLVTRLTRLITTDTLTQPPRDKLASFVSPWIHGEYNPVTHDIVKRKLTPVSRVAVFVDKLVGCDWCTSVWLAAAIAPVAWVAGGSTAFQLVAIAAGLSYLGTLAITLHDALDRHANY